MPTISPSPRRRLGSGLLGNGTLKVNVQSSGLSLLRPQVNVYVPNLLGGYTLVGSASGSGYLGSTITVNLTGVSPLETFYVKVIGADTTAFGTGDYALSLSPWAAPSRAPRWPSPVIAAAQRHQHPERRRPDGTGARRWHGGQRLRSRRGPDPRPAGHHRGASGVAHGGSRYLELAATAPLHAETRPRGCTLPPDVHDGHGQLARNGGHHRLPVHRSWIRA